MTKYQTIYFHPANIMINHLKYIWNDLELKVEFLKGNKLTYEFDLNRNINFIKNLLSKISYILKNNIETEEILTLDHYFGDFFEDYSQIIQTIHNTDESFSRDEQCDNIYKLIYEIRKLIKKITTFINNIEANTIEFSPYEYKDNRIEIINNTLIEIININSTEMSKKPLIWKKEYIIGAPATIFGLILFFLGIILFFAGLYKLGVILFTVSIYILVLAGLHLFISHIFYEKLKKNFKNDLAILKYIEAYQKIIFANYGSNLKEHTILIIESAELGYDEAYVRMGELYELGIIQKKKKSKLTKSDYKLALACYRRALPNKKAVIKYNKLNKKIKESL